MAEGKEEPGDMSRLVKRRWVGVEPTYQPRIDILTLKFPAFSYVYSGYFERNRE